ncbi:MAG: hypothetical protein V4555_14410 [Acidobacteriota bacterium]
MMMPRRILMTVVLAVMSVTVAAAQTKTQAVFAELDNPLDVAHAKVNDPVSAKLCEGVTLNDGTKLPAGSILTGRVVGVKGAGGSSLSLLFDQVLVGDKKPIAVAVTVRRVEDNASDEDNLDVDPKQIKSTGDPVSKLRGVTLADSVDGSASATFSAKGDKLYLNYRTLLGCLIATRQA